MWQNKLLIGALQQTYHDKTNNNTNNNVQIYLFRPNLEKFRIVK